jgi:hypothetical protein
MFLYFGKQFNDTRTGHRLAQVECKRCGCQYFYQLTRIGMGTGTAPYFLGQGRAQRAALTRASRDLERRLERETELVPCPKCSWINEHLVDGYRKTRYKVLGKVAFYMCAISAVVALVLLPLLGFGDPDAVLPVVLILLGIVVLAGGVLGLRVYLRSRIRPNANFPEAPQVLPGTPPALLLDAASGDIVPAPNSTAAVPVSSDWCDFQLGRHNLPLVCCDCLRETTLEHAHKHLVAPVWLLVPRCVDCAQVAKRAYWRVFFTAALIATGVAAAIILPLNLKGEDFAAATFWALVGAAVVAAIAAFRATSPVKVSHRDRSRRVVRLRFRNADYGRLVAAHTADGTA